MTQLKDSSEKPSPFDSDPVGKEYLDFAHLLKETIDRDIWKQLYYAGEIPKIVDLHFKHPSQTQTNEVLSAKLSKLLEKKETYYVEQTEASDWIEAVPVQEVEKLLREIEKE